MLKILKLSIQNKTFYGIFLVMIRASYMRFPARFFPCEVFKKVGSLKWRAVLPDFLPLLLKTILPGPLMNRPTQFRELFIFREDICQTCTFIVCAVIDYADIIISFPIFLY